MLEAESPVVRLQMHRYVMNIHADALLTQQVEQLPMSLVRSMRLQPNNVQMKRGTVLSLYGRQLQRQIL